MGEVVGEEPPLADPGKPLFYVPLEGYELIDTIKAGPDGRVFVAAVVGPPRLWGARLHGDGQRDDSYRGAPETLQAPTWDVFSMRWQSDGKLLVAGRLATAEEMPRRGVVRLNEDGSIDPSFRLSVPASSVVWAVEPLPDGRIYVAGSFTLTGNPRQMVVARFHPDGSFDPTFKVPGVDTTVATMVVLEREGRILIGGSFRIVEGYLRYGVARLLEDGSVDDSFVPAVAGLTGANIPQIEALTPLPDGRVIVCGRFDTVGGIARTNIAVLLANGALDPGFNAGSIPDPLRNQIDFAHQERSGKIVIAGEFTSIAGEPRHGIARLNADGSLDHGYVADLPASFEVIAADAMADDSLLVSSFDTVVRLRGGELSASVPRIIHQPIHQSVLVSDPVAFSVSAISQGPPRYQWRRNGIPVENGTNAILTLPRATVAQAGVYYATVSNEAGSAASDVAVLAVEPGSTLPGSVDREFAPNGGPDGPVNAIVVDGTGRLLIGGDFKRVDGRLRGGVARLQPNGALDSSYSVLSTGSVVSVRALLLEPSGHVVVGGQFTTFDSATASNICRLQPDGARDPNFRFFNGASGPVNALARQKDGKILVGGAFQRYAGELRSRLVRVTREGYIDPTFQVSPPPDGEVTGIALQADGRILIGGRFGLIGNAARAGVARLMPDGSVDPSFNPGWGIASPDVVQAILLLDDDRMIVGGQMGWVNGVGCGGVVRLDRFGGVDPGFARASRSIFRAPAGSVAALARGRAGEIYIAGSGEEFLQRLHPNGSMDAAFGSQSTIERGSASALGVLPNGDLVVGVRTINPIERKYLYRLRTGPTLPAPPRSSSRPMNLAMTERRKNWEVPYFTPPKVRSGEELVWQVQVDSFEPAEYQWQIDGVNVPGGTNAMFRMPNVQPDSGSNVRVLLRNSVATEIYEQDFTVFPGSGKAGRPDPAFAVPGTIDGRVFVVRALPDGGALIGGSILTVAGKPSALITRLGPDGAAVPFAEGWRDADGAIRTLTVEPDGTCFAGASFVAARADGITHTNLVRLLASGDIDPDFRPVFSPGATIDAVARGGNGRVVVGGLFSSVNGEERANLARLDSKGVLDAGFRPVTDGEVALIVEGLEDRLLIAGAFRNVNGVAKTGVAQLNGDGTLDPAFHVVDVPDGLVKCMAVQADGKILVGGNFLFVGNDYVPLLARYLPDGRLDSSFFADLFGDSVEAMVVQTNGAIVVTGFLEGGIARLRPDGSFDDGFDPGTGLSRPTGDGIGLGIDLDSNGDALVAGLFSHVDGIHRSRVARLYGRDRTPEPVVMRKPVWDRTTRVGQATTLSVGVGGLGLRSLEWSKGPEPLTPIAGATNQVLRIFEARSTHAGTYVLTATSAAGKVTSDPVRLIVNPASALAGLADPGSFQGPGVDGVVQALLRLEDGRWMIGGDFSQVDGQPRRALARLLPEGVLDAGFDTGTQLQGRVHCLVVDQDGSLLAGGRFVLGGTTNVLVRISSTGREVSGFGPRAHAGGEIRTILRLEDGRWVVGGSFQFADNPAVEHIAILRPDGAIDPTFAASLNGGVRGVAVVAGSLVIGGAFTEANDRAVPGLARLDLTGELDADTDAGLEGLEGATGTVNAILVDANGNLAVGGRFANLPDVSTASVLRWNAAGKMVGWVGTAGIDGQPGEVVCLENDGLGGVVMAGRFSAITDYAADVRWIARAGLARISSSWQVDTGFDPGRGAEGLVERDIVECLALEPEGTFVAGGGFRLFDGVPRGGLARIVGTNAPASADDLPPQFTRFSPEWSFFEGRTLVLKDLSATDPDTPPDQLTYSIEGTPPAGLVMDSKTGVLTWTPAEDQGPARYRFRARVTDASQPPLSDVMEVNLRIMEDHTPPRFLPIPVQTVVPGSYLSVKVPVEDDDLPPTPISMWLGRYAPPGCRLGPTGVLTWDVPADQPPGDVPIELVAFDGRIDGVVTHTITVRVSTQSFEIGSIGLSSPDTLRLVWRTVAGQSYRIQFCDSLAEGDWQDLGDAVAGDGLDRTLEIRMEDQPQGFFRVVEFRP